MFVPLIDTDYYARCTHHASLTQFLCFILLRFCDMRSESGAGKDLSGMIAASADFSGVNFREAQMSKLVLYCVLTEMQ